MLAYFTEYESLKAALPVAGKAGQIELYVEELLKLDAELRQAEFKRSARVMQYLEGIGQGHKVLLLAEPVGKGLGQRLHYQAHQVVYQLAYGGGVQSRLLHLLGGVIVGLHSHLREVDVGLQVYLGMCHVDAASEYGGFTEYHVLHTWTVSVKCVFDSAEPNQVGNCGSIGEMGHQTLASALAYLLKTEYLTLELDIGHGAVNLLYLEDTAAVNVFVREVVEKILQRVYLELTFKEGGSCRTYAGQVLDVTLIKIKHQARPNIIFSQTEAVTSSPRSRLMIAFANSTAAAGPQAVIRFPSFSTNVSLQSAPLSIPSHPG